MINLQIEAETVEELHETLRKLLGSTAAPAAAAPASNGDNVVAMPTTGRKKKDAPKIETVKEETKVDAEAQEPEPEVEQTEVDELAESLEEETKEPEAVKLTQDNVRALAVRYANACAPGDAAKDTSLQDKRRVAFSELTKHFGVAKFTEIPAEKWPEVVEYVNEQRAKRKLSADAITE